MQRIPREKALNYVLSKDTAPVIRVEPEERFVLETEDAFSGRIKSEKDLLTPEHQHPLFDYEPELANPLAGPVYVKGVEKGDLLVVKIEKIIPAERGATAIKPGQGALSDSHKWSEIFREYYTHITRNKPGSTGTTRDGKVFYTDKISWNLTPFIGTIGVAPDVEVETSGVGQGVWGGNWDCRDIKEGSLVYLNCFHKGGLLYVGDVHGTQGDGEWSGIANEVQAEVILSCNIIKNKKIPYARIEKNESMISLYAGKPLEDAVNKAITHLLEWLVDEYGMDARDAYIQIAINPGFRINIYQMVALGKLQYTVGAEFPKEYL